MDITDDSLTLAAQTYLRYIFEFVLSNLTKPFTIGHTRCYLPPNITRIHAIWMSSIVLWLRSFSITSINSLLSSGGNHEDDEAFKRWSHEDVAEQMLSGIRTLEYMMRPSLDNQDPLPRISPIFKCSAYLVLIDQGWRRQPYHAVWGNILSRMIAHASSIENE